MSDASASIRVMNAVFTEGHAHTQPRIPEWTLGDRIRKAREEVEMSQEAFADTLHVHHATISKWELDQTLPNDVFATTRNIEAVTGISATWLLVGDVLEAS